MNNILFRIRDLLKNKKYRRGLILVIVIFLFANIYASNAYYHSESEAYLIKSKIGNPLLNDYDYTLQVYLENITHDDYHLSEKIPIVGYSYSGYNCLNNSSLYYDDINKTTSVTTNIRDICSIYFNLINDFDINVVILLEDTYNSNTFKESNKIPYYGYIYDKYECDNNTVLTYDSPNHLIKLNPIKQEYCKVYFKKLDTNIKVNLYIKDSNNYVIKDFIPNGIIYEINITNTKCYNNSNEIIDGDVSYVNGYINITNTSVSKCDIYLDELT